MAGAPDKVGPSFSSGVSGERVVERLMQDIEETARGDRRARYIAAGASGYDDPELFATVDRILQRAVKRDERVSLLPELLGDDDEWRLQTSLRFSSHRPVIGPVLIFVKRTVLLPMMRWLFDFSRENFRRQERVNRLLAACIEELALENARLHRQIAGLQDYSIAGRKEEGTR